MKLGIRLVLALLSSVLVFGQAGTPTTTGAWYLLNEASDIHSSDLGCYAPSQVSFADHNATITMTSTGAPFSCGGNNGTNFNTSSQSYLSGSIMWHDLNFKPTVGHPITIEVQAKFSVGWGAIWMLGGNKGANTGCQTTSPQSWDNFSTCNWSSDASDSAEYDIAETTSWNGVTSVSHNKFVNNGSVSCSQNVTDYTANFHTYHVDWSTTAINMKVDGVDANCGYTSGIPQNSMFLIIETRQQAGSTVGGLPSTMTIKYVQVCDGTTCTAPDSSGGNTLFYETFNTASVVPPAGLPMFAQTKSSRPELRRTFLEKRQ